MVLLRALETLVGEGSKLPPVIGEIIDAAPDVDPELFDRMVKKIKARGGNFTLYASRGDWPLRISSWLRGLPRAGFIRDNPLMVAGVDTIDITAAGTKEFAGPRLAGSPPSVKSGLGEGSSATDDLLGRCRLLGPGKTRALPLDHGRRHVLGVTERLLPAWARKGTSPSAAPARAVCVLGAGAWAGIARP